MPGMTEHCCKRMADAVNYRCDQHPDPFDCPDHIVYFSHIREGYGLIVHDGGSSVLEIAYCPWCGAKLPVGRHGSAESVSP
jgi:hypothetical protein